MIVLALAGNLVGCSDANQVVAPITSTVQSSTELPRIADVLAGLDKNNLLTEDQLPKDYQFGYTNYEKVYLYTNPDGSQTEIYVVKKGQELEPVNAAKWSGWVYGYTTSGNGGSVKNTCAGSGCSCGTDDVTGRSYLISQPN